MSSAKRSADNVITESTAVNQAVDYHEHLHWGSMIFDLELKICLICFLF